MSAQTCNIDDCTTPSIARGLCPRHYRAWYRDRAEAARCSISGCDRVAAAKAYCLAHYKRWRLYGDATAPDRSTRGIERARCRMPDCGRSAAARRLCQRHWTRWKRYGDPSVKRSRWDGHVAQSPGDTTRLRRARMAQVAHEFIRRDDICNRDGWVCGICTAAIDPELRWPNPQSASLDHIVPLSLGGAHTIGNVQPAHLTCNRQKGARPVATNTGGLS